MSPHQTKRPCHASVGAEPARSVPRILVRARSGVGATADAKGYAGQGIRNRQRVSRTASRRAPLLRTAARSALLVACLGAVFFASRVHADDSRVRRGETLAGLRPTPAAPVGSPLREGSISPSGLAVRCGGVLIAMGLLGGTLLVCRRRRRVLEPDEVAIRVVARKAISSRHSIVVIDVGGERVVVGLGGDRMTALAVQPRTDRSVGSPDRAAAPDAPGDPGVRAADSWFAGCDSVSPESKSDASRTAERIDDLPGETALSRRLRESRRTRPRPLEPLFSRDDDLSEREMLRPEDLGPYRRSVDRVKSYLSDDDYDLSSRQENRKGGGQG